MTTDGGKALRVVTMRCSAMPVSIRWPEHQREKDQTGICYFARFDLSAPTHLVLTESADFDIFQPLKGKWT